VIWAVAYGVAFWLGAIFVERFESTGSAGFVGALLGWAVGGAIGVLVSTYVSASRPTGAGSLIVAAAWGLSFFVAGYVAVVAGMVLAQAAKDVLSFMGQRTALTIGWALGAALGGALASALGMASRDAVIGLPSKAV
jgi:predicted MFS family arabinose efflux permease